MRISVMLAVAGALILQAAPTAAQEVYLINGINGTVTWSLDDGPLVVTPKGKGAVVPVTPGTHKLSMTAPPARGQSFSVGITAQEEFKEADLVVQGDRKFWCVTAVVFMTLPMALQADPEDCRKFVKDLAGK
jgi:hypothetical protein